MPKHNGEGESSVHILNTGGTLGMEPDPRTGAMRPAKSAEALVRDLNVPERIHLTLQNFPKLLDSTNVTYRDRVKMAEAVGQAYDSHDAFVIFHGTDSIAYTAAGITMIFKESLQKPIIVVGSQMTKTESGTDMRTQVENALRIADEFSDTRNRIIGVFSLAAGEVFDGARLRKTHDAKFAFLDTPGVQPVGSVEQPGIEIKNELVRRIDERLAIRGLRLDKKFEPDVVTLSVTADTPPLVLTSLVGSRAVKGVIIECLGAGNIPDITHSRYKHGTKEISWIDAIKIATDAGIHVGIVSPFADGKVNLDRYALGREAKAAGAISLESLTPAMADAKFRQAIALYPKDPAMIQRFISTDFAGELLRGNFERRRQK